MPTIDMPDPAVDATGVAPPPPSAKLRLYIANSTPNSTRATANLAAALESLPRNLAPPALEIIDVFSQPKRAMTDGVIVTPTLIGMGAGKRVVLMGDLADRPHLESAIASLYP
jgi:circadian clock protein KaiB